MEIHISVAPETLFTVGPVHVTNSMFMMFVVMGFLLIFGSLLARGAKLVPGRWQSLFEVATEFMLDLVESTGGKSFGRQIFPMIGSIFIFLLLANYTGILPGVGTIGIYATETTAEVTGAEHESEPAAVESTTGAETVAVEESEEAHAADEAHPVFVPILRAPTADLNMTLAMALVTFTTVQIYGIRAHGFVGRIKHMADPPFIFPIEVVSELGRIISLSARLFGNVFAGEVLLGVMYALANAIKIAVIPLFIPVIFIFLELLFGTIQALVFALLTAIYITMAAVDAHSGHEEHADDTGDHHPAPAAPGSPASAAAGD